MSGKRAALALIELDTEIAVFHSRCNEIAGRPNGNEIDDYVRVYAMNTWTLTLAARCANVSEQSVIAALLYECRRGSTCICQGVAKELFGN